MATRDWLFLLTFSYMSPLVTVGRVLFWHTLKCSASFCILEILNTTPRLEDCSVCLGKLCLLCLAMYALRSWNIQSEHWYAVFGNVRGVFHGICKPSTNLIYRPIGA
jgi:hypothetical protein